MNHNLCHSCGCNSCTGQYCASKVPIFSMLADEQLAKLTNLITRRKFKKGQVIFFEGDVSDKIYIINEGKIKTFKHTRDGKEQILYIIGEGDFIGDLSLLKKSAFQYNAEALEDVKVCTLSKDDFDRILKDNPEICLQVLESVHDRLMNLENLVQTLGTKDVEVRIAGLLVSLTESFGHFEDGKIILDMALTREEMANFIGVTRETISRKLSSLQDEGIIELVGNKRIIIQQLEGLKTLI